MRVLLVYFTGTYNTRFLTEKVAEEFERAGGEVVRTEIADGTPLAGTEGFDLVGFGYPIYGFNAPRPFLKYFRKLRFPRGQKFFIYKNSGETFAINNASSRKILRAMRRQKAEFRGEYHFVMPYNIHFEFDRALIEQIVWEDKKLLEIMFYDLRNGETGRIKNRLLYTIGAFFVGIQAIGGNLNSLFYKADKKRCNACGLCARNCPRKNISLKNGKVKFGRRCDMCMRCSFYCPQKAIRIGLLEGWKVHSYYRLESVWRSEAEPAPYITPSSEGFYRCYIDYFDRIDRRYREIREKGKKT